MGNDFINLKFIDLEPARKQPSGDVEQMLKNHTLVFDPRRTRALFFNGRFLTATDLNRERDYVLLRMADLARAGGTGVVSGLIVSGATGSTTLQVASGHGVTPTGELVVLQDDLSVDIADIPQIERLNAAFGLSQLPNPPLRNPTGLYVLALRPVEFTANPVAAYPTSLTAARTFQDGDIVEAVALTLVPYPDNGPLANPIEARARAAQRIFGQDGMPELPANALPIAMVMLVNNIVQWVDSFLVRREVGAEHADLVGLGLAPRALREAHLMQYDQHLADVLVARSQDGHFAALDYFRTLPPAGRLPAAAIDGSNFSQMFFPSQVDVELSIIPDDELPALLEESLLLQPIDLTLADELESTSVLVLLPKPRTELRKLEAQLQSLTRTIRPVAPGLVTRQTPIDLLRGLVVTRPTLPVLDPTGGIDAAWRTELAGAPLLYFVRRRHLNYKASISGFPVTTGRDEASDEDHLSSWIAVISQTANFQAIRANSTAAGYAEIVYWLASPKFRPGADTPTSPPASQRSAMQELLLRAAVFDLGQIHNRLTRAQVLDVEGRYGDADLGQGILRFTSVINQTDATTLVATLYMTGQIPAFDMIARRLSFNDLGAFKTQLMTLAQQAGKSPSAIAADEANYILTKLHEVVL